MSLLEVQSLSIGFGEQTAVRDLSFSLQAGESVGLVGESGSGKTQTALALLGLSPAAAHCSGRILLDGEDLLTADTKRLNALRSKRIAMIFQDPAQALNPYLTIGRQLTLVLASLGQTGQAARTRVLEMLERVRLPDAERVAKAYPHELSGGMRQRAMIAAALIGEPALLIADEPTTALDVTVQARVLDLLDELRKETALLLITHDLGVVATRCERLLVLEQGRLVEAGATAQVFAAPQHPHTRALLAAAPRVDTDPSPKPPDSPATVLDIDAVSVRYRSPRGEVRALQPVTLQLHAGETLAVVGESGSGKSSLARAVLGLELPESGEIRLRDKRLASAVDDRSLDDKRELQLVFQDPAGSLNPQWRVRDIVAEPLQVHAAEMSPETRAERVQSALERLGLDAALAERFVHTLSGGQAQRVAIARALICEPAVLVCDEAVAALDGTVRRQVLERLVAIQQDTGLALLFITHDLGIAKSLSHRVAVLRDGKLVELADSATLFAAPQTEYTRELLAAVPRIWVQN